MRLPFSATVGIDDGTAEGADGDDDDDDDDEKADEAEAGEQDRSQLQEMSAVRWPPCPGLRSRRPVPRDAAFSRVCLLHLPFADTPRLPLPSTPFIVPLSWRRSSASSFRRSSRGWAWCGDGTPFRPSFRLKVSWGGTTLASTIERFRLLPVHAVRISGPLPTDRWPAGALPRQGNTGWGVLVGDAEAGAVGGQLRSVGLDPAGPDGEPAAGLKSSASQTERVVQFVNGRAQAVQVLWMDFQGVEKKCDCV